MVSYRSLLTSFFATTLLSTAQAYQPGDQICSYSAGTSCPIDTLKASDTDGSVLIYPGGNTRCAFDDYTDPKTGYTTNSTFFFQVFPKPERKKLLLMFQGGGACVDSNTCNFALQCSLGTSRTFAPAAAAASTGIFNRSDPNNLFKDWNVVHIPYCTGDLHIGSKVLEGVDTGFEGLFNQTQCMNQKKKMHMNGFENSKAALAWAKANYPDVEELVLSGMSAGALAVQALALYVGDLWNVNSGRVHYGIVPDSYMGILPAERTPGSVLNFYGTCGLDLKLPSSFVDSCKANTTTMIDVVTTTLKTLPQTPWFFINSKGDRTQRYFYQIAKDGILGYPFTNLLPPADLYAAMNKLIDAYKSASSRVSSLFVEGEQHVFLRGATYYDTVGDAGQKLGDFLSQWLSQLANPSTAPPKPTPTTSSPPVRPAC
ncbi:hypothetical protein Poli38472_012077 [Pythium oligandrum]|uniref:Uncharacterized protein n=1 Tax=Pythium oligandrum TaxID=41045 RepID=A0A8K1FLB9_PYTOL|nr:hypothetical protein Poli38472_012077 [Pythium oligandrum]|eukprot:TMW66961.1 hypothetical protein Poli38472_012077 [Pythium oligandrum]